MDWILGGVIWIGWVDRWMDGIGYAIYATLDFCVEILLAHFDISSSDGLILLVK